MNKKEQKDKCRELLYKNFLTKEDKIYLYKLFKKHPNWENKKGVGVKDIIREKTLYGTKCFKIIRKDLSETDISFTQCITNRNKLYYIKKACRTAILHIIKFYKNKVKYGIDRCEISNKILYKDNTHIDHYNLDFIELFNIWISDKDIEELYKNIDKGKDNDVVVKFNNENIINSFVKFHNDNTNLRAIDKTANLTRNRKN